MIDIFRGWLRRRAVEQVQVTADQWDAAETGLPFLARLSADDRQRLRRLAVEFLAEKEWTGAQGLELTAPMQLSIALQACLPVLNLGLEHYRGWVGIVVYPGDFVIPRQIMDEAGVMHEYDDEVLGEAWEGGPVLVSWFDDPGAAEGLQHAPPGAPHPPASPGGTQDAWSHGDSLPSGQPYGVNVVIHEFAHKLDMENGAVDGLPRLPADMSRQAWLAAFEPAYEDFCRRVDDGEDTPLDPYGAEHPAEFFAVMSEAFFEAPELLRAEYPAVYGQLARFYRQDPAQYDAAAAPTRTEP